MWGLLRTRVYSPDTEVARWSPIIDYRAAVGDDCLRPKRPILSYFLDKMVWKLRLRPVVPISSIPQRFHSTQRAYTPPIELIPTPCTNIGRWREHRCNSTHSIPLSPCFHIPTRVLHTPCREGYYTVYFRDCTQSMGSVSSWFKSWI